MTVADILTPWTPPESKTTQAVIKYGTMVGLALGGLYAFVTVAPTMRDALRLLNMILQDAASVTVSFVVLVGALWLAHSILSPQGTINKLMRIPYWAAINGLTRFFIGIDPLSPITERLKAVRADQAEFEKQYETLHGIVGNLREKEESYRALSLKAQKQGQAAARMGNAKGAVDLHAHNFGSFKETADDFARMRLRLEPVCNTFQQISQAAGYMVKKLEIERTTLEDRWNVQKSVGGALQDFLIGALKDYILCPYSRIGRR